MFELRRPEPKAALTWIAVLFIALIGLALVPMSGIDTETAAFVNGTNGTNGTYNEIHYSSGSRGGHDNVMTYVRQGKG